MVYDVWYFFIKYQYSFTLMDKIYTIWMNQKY